MSVHRQHSPGPKPSDQQRRLKETNEIRRACDAFEKFLSLRPDEAGMVAAALRRLTTDKLRGAHGWRVEMRGGRPSSVLLENFHLVVREIEEHRAKIHQTLAALYRRLPQGMAVDFDSPDVIMMKDEEPMFAAAEEIEATRDKTLHDLAEFFFSDGPDPAAVLRNVFFFYKELRPDLLLMMNESDQAMMFGKTKAAVNWRTHKALDGKLHTRSMKREGSRDSYRQSAAGNRNRHNGTMRKEYGNGSDE